MKDGAGDRFFPGGQGRNFPRGATLPHGRTSAADPGLPDGSGSCGRFADREQAAFAVEDALADVDGRQWRDVSPRVVVGVPTLGLRWPTRWRGGWGIRDGVREDIAQVLVTDTLSEPISSITSPGKGKTIYLDRACCRCWRGAGCCWSMMSSAPAPRLLRCCACWKRPGSCLGHRRRDGTGNSLARRGCQMRRLCVARSARHPAEGPRGGYWRSRSAGWRRVTRPSPVTDPAPIIGERPRGLKCVQRRSLGGRAPSGVKWRGGGGKHHVAPARFGPKGPLTAVTWG